MRPFRIWDGTEWILVSASGPPGPVGPAGPPGSGRTLLLANTTYYVGPTGNDTTGDGTIGLPWLTPNKAVIHVINKIDCNGFNVVIQLADATYSSSPIYIYARPIGLAQESTFTIRGNTVTPANVVISTGVQYCEVSFEGVTFSGQNATITGAWTGIGAYKNSKVNIGSNCRFIGSDYTHIFIESDAIVRTSAGYVIAGSCDYHITVEGHGLFSMDPWNAAHVFTLTGTPAFAAAFIFCGDKGIARWANSTFSGSATGKRYDVWDHGQVHSLNTLPGSVAGTVSVYGTYNTVGVPDPVIPAASTTVAGVVEKATDAEVRSATADKYLAADHIETASAAVALSDGATVAVNWDSGIYFTLTITANRILGNPTNGQPGTWRTIRVQADTTTDRTLTFANQYVNVVPVLTNIDSAQPYLLTVFCHTASVFYVYAQKAGNF